MFKDDSFHADYFDIYHGQSLESMSDLEINGNILITGAKGMLGNAIASTLKELQLRKFLNNSNLILASRMWAPDEVKYWQNFDNIEVLTNSSLLNSRKSIDFVIHTASPSNITKIKMLDDMRIPNLNLLEDIFQLNPKKILFISSSEVYGGGSTLENQYSKKFSFENYRDWYPLIKLETEDRLRDFGEINDVPTIAIRLFHTFGPGLKINDGRSFADILWGAVSKKQIILSSRGAQVRSFLYISDAVNAILKTLFNSQFRQITLNIGSEIPLSIYEFAKKVSVQAGASIEVKVNNSFEHSPNDRVLPDLKNIKDFNWKPAIDIDTGIANTIRWMQKKL